MRWSLLCLLLLTTGCGTLGFGGGSAEPQVAANNVAPEGVMLLPDGLIAEVGQGASGAIVRAQTDALLSETAGVPILWTYDGLSGRVVPGPKYMVNTRLCRDLVHIAERDRQKISGRATVCLSRAGSWERVS
jgi:surface antigen